MTDVTFRTESGCDFHLTRTPEGDLLVSMKVEHGSKEGLATATVSSAPEGSKVILGTYASVKLDAASRAALRDALEEFDAPADEDRAIPSFPERWSTEWVTEHATDREVALLDAVTAILVEMTPEGTPDLAEPYGHWALEILRAVQERIEDEYHWILGRQSELLRDTVLALRGTPPELVWWSHHDIPQLAKAAVEVIARRLATSSHWALEKLTPEAQEAYRQDARALIVEEADRG